PRPSLENRRLATDYHTGELRTSRITTSRPSVRAAVRTSLISSSEAELLALAKIASRRRSEATSRKSSNFLAARSVCRIDNPVMLPPGRAKLATSIADRVGSHREYGRDDSGRPLHREHWRRPGRHNDIDVQPDELCGDFIETLTASLSPAKFDRDVATLDPAQFAQPLHKSGRPETLGRERLRAQEPDSRQLARVLRALRGAT